MIEDVFKLAKNAYSMAKLHRYTMSSVKKYYSLSGTFGKDYCCSRH